MLTHASSIVSSRLDYCNSMTLWHSKLNNSQATESAELSWTRHTATAEVLSCSTFAEIITIPQRIDFKLATLAYKTQTTSRPEYLRQLISRQQSGSSMSLCSSTQISSTSGSTYSNRIWQSCFQFGCTGHMEQATNHSSWSEQSACFSSLTQDICLLLHLIPTSRLTVAEPVPLYLYRLYGLYSALKICYLLTFFNFNF